MNLQEVTDISQLEVGDIIQDIKEGEYMTVFAVKLIDMELKSLRLQHVKGLHDFYVKDAEDDLCHFEIPISTWFKQIPN
jgi:hypothetical protein